MPDVATTLNPALVIPGTNLSRYFLSEFFTLGQIQDVYEVLWEVKLDPANFREKLTNVDGWIREVKKVPENVKSRRGKPPTWYKEESLTNFERMISNPEGEKIREKEVEYQRVVDKNTTEIPVVKNEK